MKHHSHLKHVHTDDERVLSRSSRCCSSPVTIPFVRIHMCTCWQDPEQSPARVRSVRLISPVVACSTLLRRQVKPHGPSNPLAHLSREIQKFRPHFFSVSCVRAASGVNVQTMLSMLTDSILSDVCLVVEGVDIFAHKAVLGEWLSVHISTRL